MRVDETVRALLGRAPMSARAVSAELGHAPAWAGLAARSERGPYLATVADVADVAGCDVTFVDRATGETVGVVEPPHRARQAAGDAATGGGGGAPDATA